MYENIVQKDMKKFKVDLFLYNYNKCLVISYLLTIVSAPKFDILTWSTIDFMSLQLNVTTHNAVIYL